jgi:hypothetical protein
MQGDKPYPGYACQGFKAAEVFCKTKGFLGLSEKPSWAFTEGVMDINNHSMRKSVECPLHSCYTYKSIKYTNNPQDVVSTD